MAYKRSKKVHSKKGRLVKKNSLGKLIFIALVLVIGVAALKGVNDKFLSDKKTLDIPKTITSPTPTKEPQAQSTATPKFIANPTTAATPKPIEPKYPFSFKRSEDSIDIGVHPDDSYGYGIYAILYDENNNVVTNQSGIYYNWKIADESIAKGEPFGGCTHGIQPSCPEDHFDFTTKKPGSTTITVTAGKDGTTLAKTTFSLTVH